MRILVYGSTGWIGSQVSELFKEQDDEIIAGKARLENLQDVSNEVANVQPDRVICAAGLTGRPNIDWCESHKDQTVKVNVDGVVNLATTCSKLGIHLTYFGTGCIYEYDDNHQLGSGIGFTEEDWPNFDGSFYSKTKIWCEYALKQYLSNTLVLRIRMPISDDLHPRSFVTKITKYEKVVDIPNSMTVLHDLLPVAIDMTNKETTGIYNFCNPGVISHNEILEMYHDIVDPNFTWKNFTLEEQAKVIVAPRSNNELDCTKLLNEYPKIPEIKSAVKNAFIRFQSDIV